jgi:multicomponent Na+:H+ antiporter subunit E
MQRLQWGAVLFVVWLGLTNSLQIQEVIAGLIVSAVIVWLTIPRPTPGTETKPWSLIGLLLYLPVFLKALVLSNLDVARRVLDPRLPIAPGIVRIRTELEQPYQRLILANSITLTPGTVTLETEGEDLYVHWIDVCETDPETAGETIKGELERAIRRI